MSGLPHAARGNVRRGQTTLDFVVGIGVFLLVIGFVTGFVPEMYASFDDSPERGLVADRAADRVVTSLTSDPAAPSVVNATCAQAFFHQSDTACGFDTDAELTTQLGIGARYRVNVSLQRNTSVSPGLEQLCSDGTGVYSCDGSGTALAVGSGVPTDRSSVDSARRLVVIDGRATTVVVSVW